jgi:hypothetical protein
MVGRERELGALLGLLEDDSPLVMHLHGIAGVGKSTLLTAFTQQAEALGASVVALDCRLMEPTERGTLQELAEAIGSDEITVGAVADGLGSLGNRVVLTLDTYEVFRLMDTWLRQVFVPQFSDNVRLILAGREPPVAAWRVAPEWQGLFRSITLESLDEGDALELLARSGLATDQGLRINRHTRGHPLALRLAASAALERPGLDIEQGTVQGVVEELTHLFLADVKDPEIREGLEAASVVRRVTHSLLAAMLPESDSHVVYDRLSELAFVESRRDGLRLIDAVHDALSDVLHAADPSRCLDYRRHAWQQLSTEVRGAGITELWRYTADMLYLIENPVTREAFFPSGTHGYAVEPARPEDGPAIHAITAAHEGPQETALLDTWWANLPTAFHVCRESDGSVAGYYCLIDPDIVDPSRMAGDPLIRGWWHHLESTRTSKNQTALFIRRWLGRDQGEAPGPVQGACWLDMKRTYMELRPRLRRVYLTVVDLPIYAPAATQLGFQPQEDLGVTLDGSLYYTAMLDFGPGSVDGWLSRLAAGELGLEEREAGAAVRYRVRECLGAGGMGVVYRADDLVLGRPVALKVLPREGAGSTTGRARFLREARTAAVLNHPNICTVYEVGEVESGVMRVPEEAADSLPPGSPFIAMELIEGRSLRDVLDEVGRLDFDQLMEVAGQLAEGLGEAHSKGIVHRDLKPQNVMVGPEGRVKLLDFGLAKPANKEVSSEDPTVGVDGVDVADLTTPGMVAGTLTYMSPEQASGQAVDARSDIFSLGTMLYEMAVGTNPFRDDSPPATVARILDAKFDSPSSRRADLPSELEAVISRCLEKLPDDRYADARELLAALEGVTSASADHGNRK